MLIFFHTCVRVVQGINTVKPVLAVTSIKQQTCLKHPNKMFPSVIFVLIFMSSPMKWGDILFLAPLSVCPSVRPSVRLSVTLSCSLYIFWTPSGIYKQLCTNVKYDETMCSAYVWPRSGQGQGHNLRFNIVWLYFVSALYFLNLWWDLQITLHKCQVWWDDVQCLCLTKVCSRSR